jgi:Ca-activated chloride channel homolog
MNRTTIFRPAFIWFCLLALVLSACGGNEAPPAPTALPPDAVVVTFTYGSEKQKWIEATTTAFNKAGIKTSAGKQIVVNAVAGGSGETMTDIVDGRTQPTLWSPASRLWLPIINDTWQQKGNSKDIVDDTECKDVVVSPVVIMMWKPMAEALGYPKTPIGWADIAKMATDPAGWASVGKPQLGRFRFGHTHPDFSNSGLQTLVALNYAAVNKQRGLTLDDVNADSTIEFVRAIESGVAHYGRSTGFFGTAMAERGPRYLSAAVVYESVVIENNTDPAKKARLEFPLVAIYPKEGTFQSDHPTCIIDAPYMTADQKEAAEIYRKYLLGKDAQTQALQFGFRPADASIALSAPISAENGADPAQPQNTLAVPNAGVIRTIRDNWQNKAKRQVNITMLIDISGSMEEEDRIRGAREGAADFIRQLADTDTLTLIVFDDRQDVLFKDLNVGQNRARMISDVEVLVPRGGTALFDSIAYALDTMTKDPDRINALVVLTDGQDTNSSTYKTAANLMNKYGMDAESATDVSIFTIGFGSNADEDALKKVATAGRGAYRKGTNENIRDVYLDISTFF